MDRQSEIDKIAKFTKEAFKIGESYEEFATKLVDNGIGTKDRFTFGYPKIDTSVGYYDGKNQLTIVPIEYEVE